MHRTHLSRFTRLAALCGLLGSVLVGWGFSPIYGTHQGSNTYVTSQLNQIAITNIPDRQGQMLRNNLIDRFYGKARPNNPQYKLDVKIRTEEEDLGILANSTSTRSLLNVYADYALKDNQDKELVTGTAHSVTGFNKLTQQYGTQSARESAIDRSLTEVSNQIVGRISLYFSNPPPPSEKEDKAEKKPTRQSINEQSGLGFY